MKRAIHAMAAGLVVTVLCSGAMGLTITQTEDFIGTPNLSETLTFDQFDDQGGALTLQSIEVITELDVDGGTFILDNDGDEAASGFFVFGAIGNISSTDVDLLDAAALPVTSQLDALYGPQAFSLTANSGDGSGDFDPTPTDGMQYDGGPQSASDSGYIGSSYFSQYIGTITYDIAVDVGQWSYFGGVSGIEYAVTPVDAEGSVTVIYTYVPEPATAMLVLLPAAMIARRRRR